MKSNYSLLLKFLSQPLVYCENELIEIFYYFINFYFYYYFIIERKNEQLREISLILVRFLYLSNFFKMSSKLVKLAYFNPMLLSFKCFPLFCKNCLVFKLICMIMFKVNNKDTRMTVTDNIGFFYSNLNFIFVSWIIDTSTK